MKYEQDKSIEKEEDKAVFTLSEHTDTTVFYGVNNSNILLLKNLFPNIRIVARGHAIKIDGSEAETESFKRFWDVWKFSH